MTADIVAAYAGKNRVSSADLIAVMKAVFVTLSSMSRTDAVRPAEARQEPVVPIRRSVFPDYIVCLEDGKKLKMLKRHLQTAYGITPDHYREKWNLPPHYPMVAPAYAQRRSSLAKEFGLGRKLGTASAEPPVRRIPDGVSSKRKGRVKAA